MGRLFCACVVGIRRVIMRICKVFDVIVVLCMFMCRANPFFKRVGPILYKKVAIPHSRMIDHW